MLRVVQPDNWSCLAACACMITGEPMAALYADVGHDGSEMIEHSQYADGRRGFALCEVTRYLAGRGFNLGMFWDGSNHYGRRSAPIPCANYPALLIVQGANFNHAVIWNGEWVLDPAPSAYVNMPLDRYDIKQWWPIVQITQGGE